MALLLDKRNNPIAINLRHKEPKIVARKPAKRKPGRPLSDNPATKTAIVKLTPAQHAKFIALGASRWVKRLLAEAPEPENGLHQAARSPKSPRASACATGPD